MNICYGIITHKNTNILKNTIDLLHKDNKIILHVDKKSNIDNFKEYSKKVDIIEDRVNVQWGMYSQIECTLSILKNAMKYKFDYICILSGDDMPLKSSGEIKKFFYNNNGKEFIGIDKNINYKSLEGRVKFEHKGYHYKKNKNIVEKVAAKVQKKLSLQKKNNNFTLLPKLYKGPNWFCISYECCKYILEYLENNRWYEEAFKGSLCGDEVFFQTIIMNSKFKDRIYKINQVDDNHMALRYIDWKSGPDFPRILDETDFGRIKQLENSDCIFARKFNENLDIKNYNNEFNLNE